MSLDSSRSPFPSPFPRHCLPVVVAFVVVGALMFLRSEEVWDAIYHFIRFLPIKDVLEVCNNFATETIYFIVAALIWTFDPPRRRTIPVLIMALLATSAVTETTKHITGRARPPHGVRMGEEEVEWSRQYNANNPGASLATVRGDHWYPFPATRPYFRDEFASFPSGHAAGAFVLATYLAVLYGRATWLWYTLAVLCAMARVEKRRHYPEDVIFGAATGFMVSSWVYSSVWAVRWADAFCAWLERRLVSTFGQRASGSIPLPSELLSRSNG